MPSDIIIEKELSCLIMQAGYEVHNPLGPGIPEKIYEEALSLDNVANKRIRPFGQFALKKELYEI